MRVAIVYNRPVNSYYATAGEQAAVNGVVLEAAAVQRALQEMGHEVTCLSLAQPLPLAREKLGRLRVDLVFNCFEGFCGSPGTEADVPAVLAELGIPFTGCPPRALSLALDKAKTKAVIRDRGINTPDYQLLGPGNLADFRLRYPCIVKPNGEDASHGISEASLVRDFASLKRQVERLTSLYGSQKPLVEEYADGREFNATVMGNCRGRVLAISEIGFSLPEGLPKIVTFAGKWQADSPYYRGTQAVCPARIPAELERRIARTAEEAFRLTGCRGYARVDMRLDNNDNVNVIEVNPNPDISPDSGAALQARAAGLSYPEFIQKIVRFAVE